MKSECESAIQAAAGRVLTKGELNGIEERIHSSLRDLSMKDQAKFMAMAPHERVTEAAKLAKERMLADTVRAHEQAINEANAKASLRYNLDTVQPGLKGQVHTLKNMIVGLATKVDAMSANFFRMVNGLHEADGGKLFGMFQDPAKQRDIAGALFGENTTPEAKRAADSIKGMMDAMADRFQRAGLTLNAREDYRTPQPQEPAKVAKAGKDAWVEDHLQWVDRKAYVNPDGRPMSDDQLRRMLGESYRSISTDGANKRAENETRGGSNLIGNDKNAPRQLFYKDADAWTNAMQKYGKSTNMYELISGHVRMMAKDITTAEQFGRNADDNITQALARAYENDQRAVKGKDADRLKTLNDKTQRLYDAYAHPDRPGNETWANLGVQLRGLMSSSQLGSLFGALPDLAGMKLAAEHSGMPAMRMFRNFVDTTFSGKEKQDYLHKLGIWQEGFQHATNRMGEDGFKNGWGTFLNEATHKAMGLNAFDRGMRSGVGLTVMDTLGKFTRAHDTLASADGEARLLQNHGITENHWNVWKAAEVDKGPSGKNTMLTPDAIYNIPDAKLDPIVEQRVAARSDVMNAEIEKRNQQTAKEQGWLAGKLDKFNDMRDRANKFLRELDERRTAKGDAAQAAVDARAELIRANVAKAEVEHDIGGYLKTETAQDRIGKFLKAVEDGAAVERKAVRERADRAVENYGRSINSAAEPLGQRRARAEARIKEAEKRVADLRSSMDDATFAKADALDKKHSGILKDIGQFASDMQERAAQRKDYADAFQKKMGDVLDEERANAKDEAAEKLLEVAHGEMQFGARGASRSSLEDRMAMGVHSQADAGTVVGELKRFALQFKSVPIGIFRNHWARMQSLDTWGSKTAYAAKFMGYSMLMGALATEIKAMINGQDPRTMNITTTEGQKFWMEAMAAGGGMGIYGDLFLNGQTRSGGGVETLMGPGVSAAWDVLKEARQAVTDAENGESKHPYALAGLRWVRKNATPFVNLWYAKAAFNRLVYDSLAENLAPGSVDKQAQRMQSKGVRYWWQPGHNAPDRAPDLSRATAQQ